jgi:peptidoglycan/LPS O-acetylase OafA/YrhL
MRGRYADPSRGVSLWVCMNRATSTYIDLLRVLAAATVFLGHLTWRSFSHGVLLPVGYSQHAAVIVFFVISGYVIAFVADQRETTLRSYAVSRMARIYSVAIPAIVLTVLVDLAAKMLGHSDLPIRWYQYEAPWKYLPLFLSFTQEFWFMKEDVFSNVPFWSLSYEVWYYIAFGLALYLRGPGRLLLLGAVALAAGPRLALLFPVWLLGVAVYRLHVARARLSAGAARLLFLAAAAAFLAIRLLGPDVMLNGWFDAATHGWAATNLRYSQFVLGDYLDGGLVALSLFAVRDCGFGLERAASWLKPLAACTFSLYLYHFPLLVLFGELLDLSWPLTLLAVLAVVYLLARVTEQRKSGWAAAIDALLPTAPRKA